MIATHPLLAPKALPLKSVRIDAKVNNRFVTGTITQIYHADETGNACYFHPKDPLFQLHSLEATTADGVTVSSNLCR